MLDSTRTDGRRGLPKGHFFAGNPAYQGKLRVVLNRIRRGFLGSAVFGVFEVVGRRSSRSGKRAPYARGFFADGGRSGESAFPEKRFSLPLAVFFCR